ncbi:MAG: hypothetical protein Q7R35_16425 [Elusimicrobiota bacterium]|nr:hypothetical protein [Elusimicrobiota bacterium]
MPWKRKKFSSSPWRLVFFALAAAAAGGILSCLAGSLLQERGSTLASKYSAFKSLTGNYSASQIKAALEKRDGAR